MRLYPGMFTGSGKTTLAHEVGTASLAYRHGAPIDVVAAGLLHGAYIVGDWGRYGAGVTEEERREVRRVIGGPAESYVHGVSLLRWNADTIAALADRASSFGQVERNVVLVKLFDVLDHLLDFGAVLFFRDAETARAALRRERAHLCQLALRVGPAALSQELEQAIDLTLGRELPADLLGLAFPGDSPPTIVARSSQRRRLLGLYRALSKQASRVPHFLRKRGLIGPPLITAATTSRVERR